jgi:hypothetical protein
MNLTPEIMREMTELAMLNPNEVLRLRFVASLPTASEEVREYWKALEQEERLLRIGVAGGFGTPSIPRSLEAALLAIPMRPPLAKTTSWRQASVPWPVAAGIILALFGVGWYLYQGEDRPPTQMAEYPSAPKEVVDKVTALAVNNHLADAPLDVTGNNPAVVTAALQAEDAGRFLFGIVMPNVATDYHLEGGSILPFGKGWAVYTRWISQGQTYSLYQFSPDSVGLPHLFSREVGIPVTGSVKSKGKFASLWSGSPEGNTSWAVVWDSDSVSEPFSGCN